MKNPAYLGKIEAEEIVANKIIADDIVGNMEASVLETAVLKVESIEGFKLEAKSVGATAGKAIKIKDEEGNTLYIPTFTNLAS